MKEEFPLVIKRQAVKLKKLKFDWEIDSYYEKGNYPMYAQEESNNYNGREWNEYEQDEQFSAPTVTLALRWLREVHRIWIHSFILNKGEWDFVVTLLTKDHNDSKRMFNDRGKASKSYDESDSKGLDFALDYMLGMPKKNKK